MKNTEINIIANNQITADTVRLLDGEGKQIGVVSLEEALNKAKEVGVDLILIAERANPPVVKLIEIGKYRYQEEKRLREISKKNKGSEVKEVRFSPFIGEADFMTRIRRIEDFLEDSNKVRVVVSFKKKQMIAKESGYEVLGKVKRMLEEKTVTDMEPKFFGRYLAMVLSPYKKGKKLETVQTITENNENAKS